MTLTKTPSPQSTSHIAHDCDVLIVGGGPAGLSLSIALSQAGLTSIVLDQQPASVLANPPEDGREIALTHPSVETLLQLGSWQELQPHEKGQIREAHVHDGPVAGAPGMLLDAEQSDVPVLGKIVPNHALRRTAWHIASRAEGVRILDAAKVQQVSANAHSATVDYVREGEPSARLSAPLVVAADSRFSAARRQLGVGAQMTDFGRTVIVCRMFTEHSHNDIAHECFGYDRTLAVLPVQDDPQTGRHMCSMVVTADSAEATELMALAPEAFTAKIQTQFDQRLGAMELAGERHSYPLVATWAQRLSGHRFALIGDAAIGMHPVTAHGYNLGLSSVSRLSKALAQARSHGVDLGDAAMLADYAFAHQRHAWPIFQGTNTVVRLFTDARPLPRVLRQIVLRGADHFPPIKAAIVHQLTGRWQRPRFGLRRTPAQLPGR